MKKFLSHMIPVCAIFLSATWSGAFAAGNDGMSEQLSKIRASAERGNADSQTFLGVSLYISGQRGSQKDTAEALEWLRKAAAQGAPGAEFYLGAAYNTGTGVAKDRSEAIKWWHKAAEHGSLDAQATLGNVYFNGPKDGFLSYLWTSYAASRGNHNAVQDHALLESYLTTAQLKEARGLVKAWDPSKPLPPRPAFSFPTAEVITQPPIAIIRTAAESGNPAAQLLLARQYMFLGKLPRDDAEASKWLHKSAEGGDAEAQRLLSDMYAGRGGSSAPIVKDPAESANWKAKAEAQDRVDARHYLNELSFADAGPDTPNDPIKAIKYWTTAAEQKHSSKALFNLGLASYKGYGVPKDNLAANKWLTLAVAFFDWKGSLEARTHLRQLMSTDQIEDGKKLAKEWIDQHPISEQEKTLP